MIPDFINGPIAPVFTAFTDDGELDPTGQCNLLDYLVDHGGISAYFVRSGLGQMYTFRFDEIKRIAETACSHMADKGPVLVGASGEWDRNRQARPNPADYTRQAVELSRYAVSVGAAGIVHTMPEAIAFEGDHDLEALALPYFEAVCEAAADLPVFVYQPPNTAPEYCITVELVRKLADVPNIKGIKVSTRDAMYILDLTWAVAGKDFAFISGAETAFYAGLCSGSRAVIGQGATINPWILRAIQTRFEAGDRNGAIEAQRTTNLLVQKCSQPVEFFKRYITEQGYPVSLYRRPMIAETYAKTRPAQLSEEDYADFKKLLEEEQAKYPH